MILQLNPPLHMNTPKGPGIAQLVIDYGLEADLLWIVALNEGGGIWCFPNWDVQLYTNMTAGRTAAKVEFCEPVFDSRLRNKK